MTGAALQRHLHAAGYDCTGQDTAPSAAQPGQPSVRRKPHAPAHEHGAPPADTPEHHAHGSHADTGHDEHGEHMDGDLLASRPPQTNRRSIRWLKRLSEEQRRVA